MKKILIVDDEPFFLQLLEGLLESVDCEIIKTTEGEKVSRLLETEHLDLLITDIHMPDKEGIEIIRETRLVYPNLPIIVISAAITDFLTYAKDFGATLCISKPIDKDVLLLAVNKYL